MTPSTAGTTFRYYRPTARCAESCNSPMTMRRRDGGSGRDEAHALGTTPRNSRNGRGGFPQIGTGVTPMDDRKHDTHGDGLADALLETQHRGEISKSDAGDHAVAVRPRPRGRRLHHRSRVGSSPNFPTSTTTSGMNSHFATPSSTKSRCTTRPNSPSTASRPRT